MLDLWPKISHFWPKMSNLLPMVQMCESLRNSACSSLPLLSFNTRKAKNSGSLSSWVPIYCWLLLFLFFSIWYEEAKVWICWYQAFSPVGFSFIFLKEKTSWATALSAKHTTITLFKTRSKHSKIRYLSHLYKCAASQEGIKVPRNFSPFSCEIWKYIVFVVVRGWASEEQQ